MSTAELEIIALRERLDVWSLAYHRDDNPLASDAEYDTALRRLRDLESLHPEFFSASSPTQRVGDTPLVEFVSVRHKLPMLSLDNAFSGDDLAAFEERNAVKLGVHSLTFCCEPKLDGVALSLVYENGILVRAARGCQFLYVAATASVLLCSCVRLAELLSLHAFGLLFFERCFEGL